MAKVTEKKIKHLKKRSMWPSIIFCLGSIIMGAILIFIMVMTAMSYIIERKNIESIGNSNYIKEIVSEGIKAGKDYEEILSLIEQEDEHPNSVSICDSKGELLAFYGEHVNSDINIFQIGHINIKISSDYDDIKEADQDLKNIGNKLEDDIKNREDIRKEAAVNLSETYANFIKISKGINDKNSVIDNLNKEVYRFYIWAESDIEEEGIKVYSEYEETINYSECILILIIAAISSFMFLILIIIHMIHAVVNILNQRNLLKLLLMDQKTGGNNFLAFTNLATKELCFFKKYEFAIVSLSMPQYQKYCTFHGVEEAEKLLTAIDYCLGKCLKKEDIHARVSNADFVLLLRNRSKNPNENDLINMVKRLMKEFPESLMEYHFKDGKKIAGIKNIKFKAGLYRIPAALTKELRQKRKKKNIDIDRLYIKSGIALNGLNEDSGIMVYNHDMWEKELWEQTVEEKMEEALLNKEFHVYIQPKYNPVTEELVGGEALVRWISPSEGFIPPGRFIPIFEKNGFVTKLDDYMIAHTASLQANWLKSGKKIVPISVNVSRAHFAQPDLAEHIRDLVDQYPISHEFIEIELTESAFFDDKSVLLSTVKKLQEYGFEVSMDDFGSGYSSLNSLKDLPLNVLKLDAEFFRGDDFDKRGEIVVSKAIALAKQLNMRIVAEGVEKKEQVDFLASQNCDMIQGYYFAKPMPTTEFESRMSDK